MKKAVILLPIFLFFCLHTVDPLVFEKALGVARVQVMFPQGVKIMPTYNMGMPLGTEKPLLEPRIQAGGNKEGFSGEKNN